MSLVTLSSFRLFSVSISQWRLETQDSLHQLCIETQIEQGWIIYLPNVAYSTAHKIFDRYYSHANILHYTTYKHRCFVLTCCDYPRLPAVIRVYQGLTHGTKLDKHSSRYTIFFLKYRQFFKRHVCASNLTNSFKLFELTSNRLTCNACWSSWNVSLLVLHLINLYRWSSSSDQPYCFFFKRSMLVCIASSKQRCLGNMRLHLHRKNFWIFGIWTNLVFYIQVQVECRIRRNHQGQQMQRQPNTSRTYIGTYAKARAMRWRLQWILMHNFQHHMHVKLVIRKYEAINYGTSSIERINLELLHVGRRSSSRLSLM